MIAEVGHITTWSMLYNFIADKVINLLNNTLNVSSVKHNLCGI